MPSTSRQKRFTPLTVIVGVIGILAGSQFGLLGSELYREDAYRGSGAHALQTVGLVAGAISGLLVALYWLWMMKISAGTRFHLLKGVLFGIFAGLLSAGFTHMVCMVFYMGSGKFLSHQGLTMVLLAVFLFGGGVGLVAGMVCSLATLLFPFTKAEEPGDKAGGTQV